MLEDIRYNHRTLQNYSKKLEEQLTIQLPEDIQSIVFLLEYPNDSKVENLKSDYSSDTNDGRSDFDDEDEKPIKEDNTYDDTNRNKPNHVILGQPTLDLSEVVSKISNQITLKKVNAQKLPIESRKLKRINRNANCSSTIGDITKPPIKDINKVSRNSKIIHYRCFLCHTNFTGERELLRHSKKLCVQTSNLALKQRNIKNSTRKKNNNNVDSTSKEICDQCGKTVACNYLIKHKRLHENKQKRCPVCAQFINKTSYDKHMFAHSGQPKMKYCPHCDYKTKYIEVLNGHINKDHLHVRPYKCDTCQKGFHSKMLLREHVRIHSRLKTEQCHVCGHRFSYKKSLILHMRIHTGYAPYKCDMCDESFLSASRRQTHKLTKHTDRSFQCNICLKKFFLRSTMRSHQINVHESKKAKEKSGT